MPAKNLKRLIAFAKARPGQLNYAAGSYGGNVHLCMALFVQMAGLDIVYVPYKSGNAGLGGAGRCFNFASPSSVSTALYSERDRVFRFSS